jgi:signal transduction histidine kinase
MMAAVVRSDEQMQPLADQKSQRITVHAHHDLPLVMADRARIQQVLSNLLGNAIKFVDGGGAIHVRVDGVAEGVRFSVMDSGPGIPESDLPHLFDRHWRAKGTAHLGAGLGLAISKGIVEAHGGRIWVESELGRGTCFRFLVPRAPEDESPAIIPPAEADAAAVPEEHPATLAP